MPENKAFFVFELSTAVETETRSVRVRCRNDHVFAGEIPTVINAERSPTLLEEITQEGYASCRCPRCEDLVRLAEPVMIHDGRSGRAAVFLPEVLVHRELEIRAAWGIAVAGCDVEKLPSYYEECSVLLGRRALENWQIGLELAKPHRPRYLEKQKRRSASASASVVQGKKEEEPLAQPAGAPEAAQKKGIHAAFADLEERDPKVKSEPDIATYNEPEAQFDDDDDWLNDAMFDANSRVGTVSPPADAKNISSPIEPDEDLPTLASLDEPEEGPARVAASADDDEEEEIENVEEIDEADISIITGESKQRRESRPTAPLPTQLDAPASRSTCGVESGKVVLGRCAPIEVVRLFSEKPGDLRVQYQPADDVPVVALSLVGAALGDDEEGISVVWFLDLAQSAHREVLQKLQRAFSAEVRLFTKDLEEAAQFQVSAPREKNAARIWERIEALGSQNWSAEQLEAARKKVERDLESGALEPSLEESRLERPVGLDECAQRLSFFGQWLAKDAYEELIFVRSFSLEKLETAVAQTLEVALELGLRIPSVLKEAALKQSGAADFAQMLTQQVERLKASSQKQPLPVAESVRLWAGHLAEARALNAALSEDIVQYAREEISRAGKDPDEEIEAAAQSLVHSGEQLPS